MKKIVALVLSLVMVLGLATTAFAAANELSGAYDFKSVNETGTTLYLEDATVYAVDATAQKDTDKDGLFSDEAEGNVAYFQVNAWDYLYFVQVASVADADYTVYYANSKTVFAYVKAVAADDVKYFGTGAAFDNFGDECGQLDVDVVPGAKYYTFEGAVYMGVKATASTTNLMVAGEIVPVTPVAAANSADWVAHTAVYTYDKDFKVVAIKCSECGAVANIVKNYASLPKANQAPGLYFNVNGTECAYWTAAVAAPEATDKVESAQTFDAGIAMYVGMSVMAAAGSAVVLKKKD